MQQGLWTPRWKAWAEERGISRNTYTRKRFRRMPRFRATYLEKWGFPDKGEVET